MTVLLMTSNLPPNVEGCFVREGKQEGWSDPDSHRLLGLGRPAVDEGKQSHPEEDDTPTDFSRHESPASSRTSTVRDSL